MESDTGGTDSNKCQKLKSLPPVGGDSMMNWMVKLILAERERERGAKEGQRWTPVDGMRHRAIHLHHHYSPSLPSGYGHGREWTADDDDNKCDSASLHCWPFGHRLLFRNACERKTALCCDALAMVPPPAFCELPEEGVKYTQRNG